MSKQLQILLAVIVSVSALAGFMLAHFLESGPTPTPPGTPGRSPAMVGTPRRISFPLPDSEAARTDALRVGRKLFVDKGCCACHRLGDEPLPGVLNLLAQGPDLNEVGKRLSADEILESIINPNAVIAEPREKYATGSVSRMPSPVDNFSATELIRLTQYLSRRIGTADPSLANLDLAPAALPPPPPTTTVPLTPQNLTPAPGTGQPGLPGAAPAPYPAPAPTLAPANPGMAPAGAPTTPP